MLDMGRPHTAVMLPVNIEHSPMGTRTDWSSKKESKLFDPRVIFLLLSVQPTMVQIWFTQLILSKL